MATLTGAVLKYPARVSFAAYAGMILAGTALLASPWSQVPGREPVSTLDAAFTATSALCVTGLTVRSTLNDFSLFGQAVILVLIQMGGIGILTVTNFLTFRLGSQESLRVRAVISQALGGDSKTNLPSLLRKVILATLAIEGVGFLVLAARNLLDLPPGTAMWNALFHSVSAFCNAGFALHDDNLIRYQADPLVNLTIIGLIVFGGVGYPVMVDLRRESHDTWREKWDGLHMHSKIMLLGTAVLIVFGTAAFMLLEWENTLRDMPWGQRLLVSLFQSVTCRTAGFNTVDIGSLTNATLLIMMLLMAVGAGPCSTAGGIKVSTVAVLLIRSWSAFAGHTRVNAFRRTIPGRAVAEASTTVLLYGMVIVFALCGLLFSQQTPVPHHATQGAYVESQFEVVSALGTVGLSTGLTSRLTGVGRLIIIGVMFLGRLGPISVFIAVSRSERRVPLEYAQEEPLIG